MRLNKKKFVTLLAVSAILATQAGSVLAEPVIDTTGKLVIEKSLELKDETSFAPKETFTFKIEPSNIGVGDTVDKLTVKEGKALENADSISSKEFTNNDKGTGKIVTDKTATYDFSKVQFDQTPAIYRYKVTENAGQNTDVVTYDTTAYLLDVYVNEKGQVEALVAKKLNAEGTQAEGEKVPLKFTNAYETETLTIEKTVTGVAGDQQKEFNFKLKVEESSTLTAGTVLTAKKHKAGNQTEDLQVTVGTETSFKLKHGEKIVLTDLPKETKYTVAEDEANKDGYETTVTPTISAKSDAEGSYVIKDGANEIDFVNTNNEITPTGLMLTVAPYAMGLLLVAGLGTALVVKKRKESL